MLSRERLSCGASEPQKGSLAPSACPWAASMGLCPAAPGMQGLRLSASHIQGPESVTHPLAARPRAASTTAPGGRHAVIAAGDKSRLKPQEEISYPPAAWPWAAGAGPGAAPGAALGGGGRAGMAAERRYHGSSPKPPPVWAGSRLSKALGVAVMALILFQSMVLFRVLRFVCQGRLWSPNQSYLQPPAHISPCIVPRHGMSCTECV